MTTLAEIDESLRRRDLTVLDRAIILAQRRRDHYFRSMTPLELIETAIKHPNSTALDRALLFRQHVRASLGTLTSGEVTDLLTRLDRKEEE